MNKTVPICIAAFALGGGTGFLVARQLLEKKYTEIAESEIDSMREMFERQRRTFFNIENDSGGGGSSSSGETSTGRDGGAGKVEISNFRHLPNVVVRSSLDDNKYEQAKKKYDLAGRMADEDIPDELVDAVTEEVIDTEYPYMIDDVQYAEECDHFAKLSLMYYLDGIICDENEEMLDDVVHTIGQKAYDLLNVHPANMWIRNEPMGVDYEILVVNQEFGEPELLDSEEESKMRRRKQHEEK